jgi:hypothetical protein
MRQKEVNFEREIERNRKMKVNFLNGKGEKMFSMVWRISTCMHNQEILAKWLSAFLNRDPKKFIHGDTS